MERNKNLSHKDKLKKIGIINRVQTEHILTGLAHSIDLHTGQNLSNLYGSEATFKPPPLQAQELFGLNRDIMLRSLENLMISDKGKEISDSLQDAHLNSLTNEDVYSILSLLIRPHLMH